ncbi:uncharacterized protein LOC120294418 [Eucalyptus grandis]|uniref:uncharacterized protein LOC120294418 n=1 Tax=Eucalyptus grandis TaxID=71139 RepID=UPI00192EEBF8|nr:uncharacterized protein LOC120294418 [Eucalyptus grandis]
MDFISTYSNPSGGPSIGVLALTAFRFRDPELKLDSIAITNISSSLAASVNLTLGEEIRVRNQNWGPFEINDSVGVLTFLGARIGENEVADRGTGVKKRSSRREAVAIEAGPIDATSGDGANSTSDAVEIGAYAYVSGEVSLLGVFKRRRSGSLNCTASLSLTTRAVRNLSCR